MVLKIAVPNKGRLSESTIDLLKQAGLRLDYSHERSLFATTANGRFKVLFLRAADIAEFVADGVAHVGITGADIIHESGRAADLDELLDLRFGRCRLVVAVPEESNIRTPQDIPDGAAVATSFPRSTRAYFDALGKPVRIIPVSGATEITPHLGVADLVTDLTSTGSTMLMNGLREIDQIIDSTARVIASKKTLADGNRADIEEFVFALQSVIAAAKKRYLLADVPTDQLEEIRTFLPGLEGPTVVNIVGRDDMVAIHVVVDEDTIFESVSKLKRLGGKGILVMPIDRMVA